MKVSVRLISIEGPRPDGISESGEGVLAVADGTSLATFLDRLNLPDEGVYAVLVDDAAVGPEDRESRILQEGETVTVLPPIKGG